MRFNILSRSSSFFQRGKALKYVKQYSGPLTGRQIAGIDRERSDHKELEVRFSAKGGERILFGNELKQCFTHNNGFGKQESPEQYLERYMRQIDARCKYIRENTLVVASHNQESVIKPEHIEKKRKTMEKNGVFGDHYHTNAGVSSFFPETFSKAFYQVAVDTDRLLVFRSSEAYCQVNLHTPWPDKIALSEAVKSAPKGADPEQIRLFLMMQEYKKLVRTVLSADNLPKEDGVPLITVDLIGDTNLPPAMQSAAIKEACAEMDAERVCSGLPSFSVVSYAVGSPDGHVQKRDGRDEYVDVDSYRRLLIIPSLNPKVHEFTECPTRTSAREKIRLALGALVSGGLILSGSLFEEDVAFEAFIAVVATDPKLAHDISQAASLSVAAAWKVGGPALLATTRVPTVDEHCHFAPRQNFGKP